MKKTIKIFTILLLTLILCSCGNKAKNELIPITAEELTSNIFNNNTSAVIALYRPNENNSEAFLKDLNQIVKDNDQNIYILNMDYITSNILVYLELTYEQLFEYNSYIIINNGEGVVYTRYTNYGNLKKDLIKAPDTDNFNRISDAKKQEYFKKAKEYFDNGKIAESYSNIVNSSTLDEAKEFYNKNQKSFYLLGSWVSSKKIDKKNYHILCFNDIETTYYNEKSQTDDLSELSYDKKYINYYKLQDDIIYVSDKNDGNYNNKKYQILEITNKKMLLLDIKANKKIEYIKKG